jgi:hypothetical protein
VRDSGARSSLGCSSSGSSPISHAREDYVRAQRRLQDHPLVAAFEADGRPHHATFIAAAPRPRRIDDRGLYGPCPITVGRP